MYQDLTPSVVVIGKESTGKSQLISSLTGRPAYAANFRGTTVACEVFQGTGLVFVDTPGILRQSDTLTTREALKQVTEADTVVLVVQATQIDNDLSELLPVAVGKRGVVVVTFWDKVGARVRSEQAIHRLSEATGLPFIPVDARHLSTSNRSHIYGALADPPRLTRAKIVERAGWQIEPPATVFEHPLLGPWFALLMLILPAVAAVFAANTFAALVDPVVQSLIAPLLAFIRPLPSLVADLLAGNYGFFTMFPLLFVWAVPTVVLYALILGVYKSSGLLDRLTVALDPLMHSLGLSGRDLVRIIMGFGCNVPAVINTRACSACSRGTCISAIAFGAACSYQFGATLAVFGAAGLPSLVVPYLLYLTATSLIYTRLTAPPEARSRLNLLLIPKRSFLLRPTWKGMWTESRLMLRHFFRKAIPIFFLITVAASLLDWLGVVDAMARPLQPLMAFFHLPSQAALPVLLAAIRKDGILLFAKQNTIAVMTPGQILTGVYLAGVLLPCLVTAITIAREQSPRFAARLMLRQAGAACLFSLLLAWSCAALHL